MEKVKREVFTMHVFLDHKVVEVYRNVKSQEAATAIMDSLIMEYGPMVVGEWVPREEVRDGKLGYVVVWL